MSLSKQKIKSCTAMLLTAFLLTVPLGALSYAETTAVAGDADTSPTEMTVSDLERNFLGTAIIDRETALALAMYSTQAFESLTDARRELRESIKPLLQAAEAQEKFEKAYEMLKKAYGPYLPSKYDYTKEEKYNYFYSARIQAAPLQAELDKLELQFNTAEAQVAVNVDLLYSNLMSLIKTEALQKRYMEIQDTLAAQYDAKYEAGVLSENDYNALKAEVETARLTYRKVTNERENLELQLKDLLGLSYDESVYWKDSYAILSSLPLESVEVYVDSALANRNEIAAAELDFQAASDVYDLQVDALYDISDVNSARIEKARKERALEDEKVAVEIEIRSAYEEIQQMYAEFELDKQTYFNSKAAYERGKEQVKLGVTIEVNLDLLKFAADSDYATMSADYVQYNLAVDRFLKAAGYGPAYTSGTLGGN
ncbi:MAG: hypothetical protein PWQ12_233 [Clostridiales bacterium]|nr:hypothetical protein [Clostridiales bacterium]